MSSRARRPNEGGLAAVHTVQKVRTAVAKRLVADAAQTLAREVRRADAAQQDALMHAREVERAQSLHRRLADETQPAWLWVCSWEYQQRVRTARRAAEQAAARAEGTAATTAEEVRAATTRWAKHAQHEELVAQRRTQWAQGLRRALEESLE